MSTPCICCGLDSQHATQPRGVHHIHKTVYDKGETPPFPLVAWPHIGQASKQRCERTLCSVFSPTVGRGTRCLSPVASIQLQSDTPMEYEAAETRSTYGWRQLSLFSNDRNRPELNPLMRPSISHRDRRNTVGQSEAFPKTKQNLPWDERWDAYKKFNTTHLELWVWWFHHSNNSRHQSCVFSEYLSTHY